MVDRYILKTIRVWIYIKIDDLILENINCTKNSVTEQGGCFYFSTNSKTFTIRNALLMNN
jgi:hypothetical protein